ncbi:type II CAAX endopeptidase family protein [Muricomes intestini]|jgi:membrane protease YdiL (CAAX protease family)|uniref:type II CAAX endopeptidase family protein n=1 Tax=Muricomes intestini TaxID=1796634 RepID=UPI000E88A154|nr:CPBP family intramembrane metalloprotease domain-containing protein [Lachnospiraceae bacterium]HCR82142.1 CPBP family intramembrane metalloprotease domain-containing protein [Lachnospiraceae bacterium]
MYKDYKQIKFWQGLLVVVLAAVIIFIIAPVFLAPIGMYGTLLAEWMMLAVTLGLVMAFGHRPGDLLPLKKPSGAGVFGTLLMWVGAYLVEMTLILVLSIFFPEDILDVNAGLSQAMVDIPFLAAFLIIAVTPAICEEVVFRGVFLKSLNSREHKWMAILICGIIFGLFHGNVFRFIPTAIGGAVMAYILLESENMFYNCFFHFINNLLPVLLLFSMKNIYKNMEMWNGQGYQPMPAASAGVYMMMCAAAPSCLYIGNYLLHSKTPGYRDKLFPRGKQAPAIILVVISSTLFLAGAGLTLYGIVTMPMP